MACFDFGAELTLWGAVRGGYPLQAGTARTHKAAKKLAERLLNKAALAKFDLAPVNELIGVAETTSEDSPLYEMACERVVQKLLEPPGSSRNTNVFIVHGHDEAKKWELKNFLSQLDVNPIILHEQDDLGKTIIEKFEYYAANCAFAFVLLTPDDRSVVNNEIEDKWRARQNVIMELGWFMAKLGRERVAILHKGEIDIPSDILGVIYLKFERNITEISEKIRSRLKGANMIA